MMNLVTYNSRDARMKWREILDILFKREGDVMIERNGEPVAVLIPANDYQHISEMLEDYRDGREAEALLNAWKNGGESSRGVDDVISDMGLPLE
jgi:prevent-host-death family protein